MDTKNLFNKLLQSGWITFNPHNLNLEEKRYTICLDETEKVFLQDVNMAELLTDLIIKVEKNCPYPQIIEYKDNALIDCYAYDSFVEVTWQLSFDTLKELKEYKKKQGLEELAYIDNSTDTACIL